MITDVMVDIETLGTANNAPILAIGAVVFDPRSGEIGDKFYASIALASALEHGVPSGDTLRWWMEQGDDARREAFNGTKSLREALIDFATWYSDNARAAVWANGPSFDIAILETAFRGVGLSVPWPYNAPRDCRTIKALADGLVEIEPRSADVAHNALDDAIWQARCVALMWQALRR